MVKKVSIDSILGYPESYPVEIVIKPAYGKCYKSGDEVLAAWKSGKDFKIVGGSYCSIRDRVRLRMMGDILHFKSYGGISLLKLTL